MTKKNDVLVEEKVYSSEEDKKIRTRKDIGNSPIWKKCHTEEEFLNGDFSNTTMYCYTIKFDGTKPVQVTNVDILR